MHRDRDELRRSIVNIEIRVDFGEFDYFCIDKFGGKLNDIEEFTRTQSDRARHRSSGRVGRSNRVHIKSEKCGQRLAMVDEFLPHQFAQL